MQRLTALAALATVTALTLAAVPMAGADAQSWGDRLKKKAEEAAKKKVEQRTEKRAGEAADKALDTVECAASDKACQEKKAAAAAAKEGRAAGHVAPAGAEAAGAAVSLKPGEGAWANYDFKPGDRVIFAEDFTSDEVGDFPRRMEFKSGALEIVAWNGGRWLRGLGAFYIPLPETLPERFTIEFDMAGPTMYHMYLVSDNPAGELDIRSNWAALSSGAIRASADYGPEIDAIAKPVHIAISVDGKHVKLYANGTRVFNAPNGHLGRSNKIHVSASSRVIGGFPLLANLRIAAGGKKLYDALAEKGRVATQGIFFDTGSDQIRPESTPTLKEIGQMLTEHSDLKLTIEGHTDNVGNSQSNLELSQRRAAAVKAYLVEKHGVDASRLTSAGFGDKKPAAKNDTPEGRQQNRRVELVKM
jgi:outer membrane protein OmpA-like peptidoglycan-associated protein